MSIKKSLSLKRSLGHWRFVSNAIAESTGTKEPRGIESYLSGRELIDYLAYDCLKFHKRGEETPVYRRYQFN